MDSRIGRLGMLGGLAATARILPCLAPDDPGYVSIQLSIFSVGRMGIEKTPSYRAPLGRSRMVRSADGGGGRCNGAIVLIGADIDASRVQINSPEVSHRLWR
jgi:hypothetical protein